ncbi:uncharacterized protein LOC135690796 [Rhopilema esculentum]|uniref:uncharacterized protein LOC135690796 n=1 Tax=Rhopilema esculentum TaxID=499914 RepID=UPI0031D2B7CB|eukprot:gene1503-15943_t
MMTFAVFVVYAFGLFMTVKSDFAGECLFAHNVARGQHEDTPDLTWDADLATSAESYAQKLASDNQKSGGSSYLMDHSPAAGRDYGENIYIGNSGGLDERKIANAMYFWYREGIKYNYESIAPWTSTGHFTQVIWKSTTTVGCGKALYYKNLRIHTIIVCQYKPKGNTSMQFLKNVMKLKAGGKESLSVEELTGTAGGAVGGCAGIDLVPLACNGMKPYCNDASNPFLTNYLQKNCKKTCYC